MTLQEYIANIGDKKAAELFKVHRNTAESWRAGRRRPRPEKAKEIVSATGGEVSFFECYKMEDKQ